MLSALKERFRSILPFLAIIGPGIIAAAAGNDAGGVTTYSVAGAHYGYSLLWVMIIIAVVLVIVQEMCGRMGVVSGKGLADLIREVYGARVAFFILFGLFLANISTVMSEFAGIAGALEIFSIPRFISVPLFGILIWLLIIKTNYRIAEKVFLVGAFLFISYIISGVLAHPDWSLVARNSFIPTLKFDHGYVFMIIGLVGTTIAPWMQFYLQASTVEKSIKIEQYKYVKFDIIFGSILSIIISAFIMIAAAATLFVAGITIKDASDAALALGPLAGNAAEYLFAIGLLNASLLGAMIVPIATAYYVCEGLGFESGLDKTFKEAPVYYGIFTFLIVAGAIPLLFPSVPLVKIMLVAQVINGILLAPVLIFIIKLVNKKWLMGKYVNKPWYNVIAWISVVMLIALSGLLVVDTIF